MKKGSGHYLARPKGSSLGGYGSAEEVFAFGGRAKRRLAMRELKRSAQRGDDRARALLLDLARCLPHLGSLAVRL